MKKLIFFLFLILNFSNYSVADNTDRNNQLNKLFKQLKNTKILSSAEIIEGKIWKIWSKHPTQDILTNALAMGVKLMNSGELVLGI